MLASSIFLLLSCLLTIYKSFIKQHLDYVDVIYDQPSNASFSSKIESVQRDAALAIIGAIRSLSREKVYKELGLKQPYHRRWMRRICSLYKVLLNKVHGSL